MLMQRFTMRASLTITIVVMGLFGMGLALLAGQLYHQQTLDNQRAAMVDLLRLKTTELLSDLDLKSRDLGSVIQHNPEFRRAFAARDVSRIARLLDNQFHQYFQTAEVIKIQKLRVFDLDFSFVAESTEGDPALADGKTACPELIEVARARLGRFRLLPMSRLCLFTGTPYYATIVPIGGLRPTGYLHLIVDPIQAMVPLETALGTPLKIELNSGRVAYKSKSWLPSHVMDETLVAGYPVLAPDGSRAMTVSILYDIRPLFEKLAMTRYLVMLVAGLMTLLMTAAALLVLHKTALRPLMALHDQLRNVRKDRTRLGETLSLDGTIEIRKLSQDFNAMSTELHDLHQVLERMAFTDALTELPNRTHFHGFLEARTRRRSGDQSPFALLVLDLDRFKEVNDSFGHDIGDQLLKQVSARLKSVMRRSDVLMRLDDETAERLEGDVIARLGGDEFGALVSNIGNEKSAESVAMKLIKVMEQPFLVGPHRFHVGLSIGIALYPQNGIDPVTLLREADIAMYQAKQSRCGYALFDGVRDNDKLQQLTMERDLRLAIENDGLELYYQPIINARTGKAGCFEALARWRYPDRDFTPPDRFIFLAEQRGLIRPLTRWVLDRALQQCAQWRQHGYPADVSVNLSAMNLHEADLVEYVMQTLQRWKVEPSWLTLELTESAVMADPNHAFEVLSLFDASGVRISIDDFGAGYSSLAYLKRLPVDEIKIDKSFVLDMKRDSNDAVIVHSTIDLAHNMSLEVVAEGVENLETLRLLELLGCDKAQGFHISRPLPYQDLLRWIGESPWGMKRPRKDAETAQHKSQVAELPRTRPRTKR